MERLIWLLAINIIQFQVNGYPKKQLYQNKPYENPNLDEGDMLFPDDPVLTERGVARRGVSVPWTNGIVPYEILPGYAYAQQSLIIRTMEKMERLIAINNSKCIQFRERNSTDRYFITIANGIGCASYVGQNTGINITRRVTLQHPGCIYEGIIMHELLHALGFYHEQSRPDRDNYIRINYENIQPGKEHNFEKYSNTAVNTQNTPYDHRSVMHYEANAFSKNGLPTIESLVPNTTVGQRNNMTTIDIYEVRLLYNCTASSITLPTTPVTTTINFHIQITLYSSLTINTQRYSRYGGISESNYYYERYRIIVSRTDSYMFRSNSSIDTYGFFYSSTFDSDYSYRNLIADDDNSAGNGQFQIQMYLQGGFTYELVVTTSNQYETGSYSIIVLGLNPISIEKIIESAESTNDFATSTSTSHKFCFFFILWTIGYFIQCKYLR